MVRGVRWWVFCGVGLVALAGCGRGFMNYVQREPWREQAETAEPFQIRGIEVIEARASSTTTVAGAWIHQDDDVVYGDDPTVILSLIHN